MNTTAPINGRVGLKGITAALLAACAMLAIGLAFGPAKANAANAGDPINADFNYVGLDVDVTLAQVSELVLEDEGTPLKIQGQYTDSNGNFTLPKANGLIFPAISIEVDDDIDLYADISLDEDATGNYNETTGAMSVDMKIALTISISDIGALPIPGLGTGPLGCVFAPINASFSTSGGWPAPGSAFADPATIENGALAGAWRSKPKATVIPGQGTQATCDLISGVLQDVGGLWLANSSTPISDMPDATSAKPDPETCEEHGLIGRFPNCEEEVLECPEGQVGTPPNCEEERPIIRRPNIARVAVSRAVVRPGGRARIRVTVVNRGNAAFRGPVRLRSSNRHVRVPQRFRIAVGPKKRASKVIVVRTTRRARGRARIIAAVANKRGAGIVAVRAAKRARRR